MGAGDGVSKSEEAKKKTLHVAWLHCLVYFEMHSSHIHGQSSYPTLPKMSLEIVCPLARASLAAVPAWFKAQTLLDLEGTFLAWS